ncbi:transposase [Nocardioides massiliensis]|uniref:transposase n=1 Tax=Nocardioides massiliensis TaxID=1325935 RepID=UPI003520323E
MKRVADQLGVHPEALRNWVRQAEIDGGVRPGTTTDDATRLAELEREVRELRRANEMADSSGQRNESCEMRQSLITGGSGCRASTVISAGSRSSSRSGFTRRAGGWSTSPRRSAAVRRWSASWPAPAGTSMPSRSAGNHVRAA